MIKLLINQLVRNSAHASNNDIKTCEYVNDITDYADHDDDDITDINYNTINF